MASLTRQRTQALILKDLFNLLIFKKIKFKTIFLENKIKIQKFFKFLICLQNMSQLKNTYYSIIY